MAKKDNLSIKYQNLNDFKTKATLKSFVSLGKKTRPAYYIMVITKYFNGRKQELVISQKKKVKTIQKKSKNKVKAAALLLMETF